MNDDKTSITTPKSDRGCFFIGWIILSVILIVGATIAAQVLMWLLEQTIFEASSLFPDLRWLIVLAYISIVGIPIIIVRFLYDDPLIKKIFQFWIIIILSGIFFLPGRFVPINQAQLVGFLQVVGIIGCLVIFLLLHNKQRSINLQSKSEFLIIPILFVAILSFPWVLWGALGSLLDLVLNLLVGLLSGFFLTFLINQMFIELFPENEIIRPTGKFFFGVIIFVGLVIYSTVFGQNGQQWMLVLTIPFAGWIISGLFKNVGGQQSNAISVWLILSICITLPLVWFDPDEMSLIIGSDSGEILSWVSQAISYTVIILIVLFLVTGFLRNKIEKKLYVKPIILVAVTAWITVIITYFAFGQKGFHGETLFVIMNDQADLSYANTIVDPLDKREYVYKSLTEFSIETQEELVNFLDQFQIEYQQFYLVNALEVKGGPGIRTLLEMRDDVDRVLDNPILRPLPKDMPVNVGNINSVEDPVWNLEMIGVDKVWEELGSKGSGILIGQADSGVDGNHPALREQYAGSMENNEYTWFDPWFQTEFPTDISGHGTHTLGTILGKNVGVAPEAKWIGCVNLGRNLGNPSYYLACMQFLLAPFPMGGDPLSDGKPAMGAQIINNSWGCPEIEGCDAEIFLPAVSALRFSGIFVVSSAGNSGYYGCESVTDPLAIYDDVFSVGAIDRFGELAPFSSLGPVTIDRSERIKPDLVAPGVDIFSTMPNASYSKLSGTSMSGPHIVGTVALMWSANPDLIGNIDLTKEILINTATQFTGFYPGCVNSLEIPNNAVGFGVINAFHAVEEAIQIK